MGAGTKWSFMTCVEQIRLKDTWNVDRTLDVLTRDACCTTAAHFHQHFVHFVCRHFCCTLLYTVAVLVILNACPPPFPSSLPLGGGRHEQRATGVPRS
jgi:hypothetical protein